jgi:hypothetical protein
MKEKNARSSWKAAVHASYSSWDKDTSEDKIANTFIDCLFCSATVELKGLSLRVLQDVCRVRAGGPGSRNKNTHILKSGRVIPATMATASVLNLRS